MNALEAAIDAVVRTTRDPAKRNRCVELLNGMAADCDRAAQVWSGYVSKAAGPAPTNPGVLLNWTGPELAKELFNIHLACREKWNELTEGRATLEDEIIVLAYRKLSDGETGPDAARAAVELLAARADALRAGADTLRTAKPAAAAKVALKPAGKKAASKKAVKSKPKPKAKPKAVAKAQVKSKTKPKAAAKKKKR